MKVLLTGAAGFIGMHCAKYLLERGDQVVGIDNLNDYYDVNLKQARLDQLKGYERFTFHKTDLQNKDAIADIFVAESPERVIHLAAQAGVRYSLTNPHSYIDSNLVGFLNILEGCRNNDVQHLVYSSSSSVYGSNTTMPFSEQHNIDHPISLYAATKKANELMAHTYSHLYNIPTTGLRFFTVYGPWGRPDMALFLFTKAMSSGEGIQVFNNGQMIRDFTYIDDIVEGVIRAMDKPATANADYDPSAPDPATGAAPYRVFNIGNGRPTPLLDYISAIEKALGVDAKIDFAPLQPGDVLGTSADMKAFADWVGFTPNTSVTSGVQNFVNWYQAFYGDQNPDKG